MASPLRLNTCLAAATHLPNHLPPRRAGCRPRCRRPGEKLPPRQKHPSGPIGELEATRDPTNSYVSLSQSPRHPNQTRDAQPPCNPGRRYTTALHATLAWATVRLFHAAPDFTSTPARRLPRHRHSLRAGATTVCDRPAASRRLAVTPTPILTPTLTLTTGRLHGPHPNPNPNPNPDYNHNHRVATRPSFWPLPAAISTASSCLSSAALTSTPRTR